ncbi:MAG TPA: ComF family protein [Blastocatellia bacterium]|jgi:ComF family protein|nr:ComF family protein [Blastocatellia bacterium]
MMIAGLRNFFDKALRVSATLGDAAVAALYPGACRVCDDVIESWRDGVACPACWREIEREDADFCVKCWTPLPGASRVEAGARRCGMCDHFAFDFVRSCGPYRGAMRETVLRLKGAPHIPARLRGLLRRAFDALPDSGLIESIIPMPLHPERLAERGFNQAEVIARELAELSGVRVDSTAVIRVKKTERHRAGMGARERARSLEKAFRVRAPRLVEGRAALLVDDLMTTGSTAGEITRALLDGGARSVSVLTLAKAMNEFSV